MDEKLEKFLNDKFREMEIQFLTKLSNIEMSPDLNMQMNNLIYDQIKDINRDIKEIKMILGGDNSGGTWADLIERLNYKLKENSGDHPFRRPKK